MARRDKAESSELAHDMSVMARIRATVSAGELSSSTGTEQYDTERAR